MASTRDRERWQQIEEVFQGALDLPAEQRGTFLDDACGGDATLRAEVDSLLAHEPGGPDRLGGMIAAAAAPALASKPDLLGRVGPYRLLQVLGRGGMGVVYLAARDGEFRQRVALKVVGAAPDHGSIHRRFLQERQILAGLEHPNIARLLDGGTTEDGRPYLVMEYVDGVPIHEHAEQAGLSVRERLELFLPVCGAVHYAHQNLVVHRDLKPGNILVTPDGTPKLLDFGIARVINADVLRSGGPRTVTGQQAMTPEYASPEQVRGERVTTASDIFSLGAVLYELLAGVRPHDLRSRTPAEIEEAICRKELARPSTAAGRSERSPSERRVLARALAGDLDTIILMAMRKEPERRYGSVEQFAGDLRRHLDGLPVTARRDTVRYRTAKFVRRHRTLVVATALVAASMVGATVFSVQQARRSERRFQQVRTLANSFLFEFHDAVRDLPGATPARALVVRKALVYLDSLAAESHDDAGLQGELAQAYVKLGDVQGNPAGSNLGDSRGALRSYRQAIGLYDALERSGDLTRERQRAHAAALLRLGAVERNAGQMTAAVASLRRAEAAMTTLQQDAPDDADAARQLGTTYDLLSRTLDQVREGQEALPYARKAVQVFEHLLPTDPENRALQADLASAHAALGIALSRRGDLTGARQHYERNLMLREALLAAAPGSVGCRRSVMQAHSYLGDVLGNPQQPNLGDREGALRHFRLMLTTAMELAAIDANDQRARQDLAVSELRLAATLNAPAERGESVRLLSSALERVGKALERDPQDRSLLRNASVVEHLLGERLEEAGDAPAALEHRAESVRLGRELAAREPNDGDARLGLMALIGGHLQALSRLGREVEALRERDALLAVLDKIPLDPQAPPAVRTVAPRTWTALGEAHWLLAQRADQAGAARHQRDACSWFHQAAGEWRRLETAGVSLAGLADERARAAEGAKRCPPP